MEASLGGPIKKDKIWFFMSARTFHLDTLPADVFLAAGPATATAAPPRGTEPGVDPQKIESAQLRLTWQITPKHKFAFYNDRLGKDRGAAMTAGFDPATASIVWDSPIYTTGSAKITSTLSNKLLFEGGASFNYERYHNLYQDGIEKVPGTPEWYTTIHKADTALGTTWNAGTTQTGMYPDRFAVMTALSYITGAHNIKVGVQDTWGPYQRFRSANGDLRANFQNGRAFQAVILNTPVRFTDNLHADVGIYGQDSWTMNRLTLNYGARWEYFSSGTSEATATPGRFTAQRTFPAIEMPTWKSFSPRFGAVYDLFGNQKTALKVSIGKYMQAGTTGFSEAYNPLALTTANVAWTDVNGDGIPQGELGCNYGTAGTPGCELNLAQLPTGFGVANLTKFDPDIKRMYNIEWSASVQHELMPRVSVTAGWFHRDYKNLFRRRNTAQTFADYTPFTMWSPIDGSAITYNNVSLAKRTRPPEHRRERSGPTHVVQRPRIQLQRAAAARHHAVRRRHDGADDRPGLRRDCRSEPAALLRPDAERHPVAHPVQDLGIGADEVRHPGQLRVPGPARLPSWHPGAVRAHRHLGPERHDEQQSAGWRRHDLADHADDALHGLPRQLGFAGMRRWSVGRSGHDGGVAERAAGRAEYGVRRSHQPARSQHLEDDPPRPGELPAEDRLLQPAERLAGD